MPAPSFSSFPERPRRSPAPDLAAWQQGGLEASTSTKVPVFGSFPDRPGKGKGGKTREEEERGEGDEKRRRRSRERERERERERQHERDDDEKRRKRHRRAGDEDNGGKESRKRYEDEKDEERRRRKRGREDEDKPKAVKAVEPADTQKDKLFYVDRAGDEGNIRYGGIEAGKIPRYATKGFGRVVGLPEQYQVTRMGKWKHGDEQGIVVTNKAHHVGDHEPTLLRHVPDQTFKITSRNRKAENRAIADQHEFVAVDNGAAAVRTRGPPASGFLLGDPDDAEDQGQVEIEEFDESDDLDEQETPERIRRRRVLEFERHLETHPTDIDQWIAFSSLHLEEYSRGRSKGALGLLADAANAEDPTVRGGKTGAYDVALATLERAIKVSPQNASSPKLQSAFFALAQQVWPPGKVTEKWQDVLRRLQTSSERMNEKELMDLWLGYISWREGRGLGASGARGRQDGGIDDVVAIYAQCIDMMRGRSYPTSEKRTIAEENKVYLLLRCILLLRHAGFHERGTAICQAMLELTFYKPLALWTDKPSSMSSQWEERLLESLEEFWESEVPRIGENGSNGWSQSRKDAVPDETSEQLPLQSESSASNDPFVRWYEDETVADRSIRPGKASSLAMADDDDDPYKIVLFDDIRPFLFVIRNPEVKLQLVYAVSNYLGLPFGVPDLGTNTAFSRDPHLQWALASNPKARSALWPERPVARQRLDWSETQESAALPPVDFFSCPVRMWFLTEETAFEDVLAWFSVNQVGLQDSVDTDFLRNTFNSLSQVVRNRSFQWLRIAFEASLSKKSTAKLCKQMLSQDRNNLSLWCTYARVLRSQRKAEEARQVYRLCTSSVDPQVHSPQDIEQMLSEWAELEWLAGRHDDLLNILVATVTSDYRIPEGKPSPVMYLKAKQHYWQSPDQASRASVVLHYLFLYVSMDFEQAFQAVQVHAASLPSGSAEQEEVLQLGAKIMFRHSRDHVVKADTQREFLEYAIALFPSNTIFLSLFFSNEFGTRVYGRLQRLLYETVLLDKDESAGSYLWAVWAESMSARRTFWESGGQGAERVRAMYEKAISSSTGKYSIPLWMSYIEFLSVQGRGEPAKRLCYRAIAHLGGCKALYMMPFSPLLRPHFTDKELRDWAELMTEKGLRIRKSFEEYWQPEEEAAVIGEDDGGDPMAVDEAYAAFEDRKRLLPY